MRAVTSIMRAQQILHRQSGRRAARPFNLTFSRYEALVLLTFSSTGALPLSKIGERLQVHATSVTNVIDRLEASGFVRARAESAGRPGHAGRDHRIRPARGRPGHPGVASQRLRSAGPGPATNCTSCSAILRRLRIDAGDFTD